MKEVITFKNEYDMETQLREEEIKWFHEIVQKFQEIIGISVPIIAYDHDLYRGKSVNALGCCCTNNCTNPLAEDGETYITIDCYYIDEKYKEKFENGWHIEKTMLEETIAHEIAHLYCWRHGKKHNELTQMILDKYMKSVA